MSDSVSRSGLDAASVRFFFSFRSGSAPAPPQPVSGQSASVRIPAQAGAWAFTWMAESAMTQSAIKTGAANRFLI
jgi:hypothetical protein